MRNYLKNKENNHFSVKGVEIFVKDKLTNSINLRRAVERSLSLVPNHLLTNLDIIYIGEFPELETRALSALYKDSSILMTNQQDSEEDIIDDIVHEIAHSVEEKMPEFIYSDRELEKEFISKRKSLWVILKDEGYEADLSYYLDSNYNKDFDEFLYLTVGYPIMSMVSSGIFLSPYAATSLREYFANGFEHFFLKQETESIKKISPKLYKKLVSLLEIEEVNDGKF